MFQRAGIRIELYKLAELGTGSSVIARDAGFRRVADLESCWKVGVNQTLSGYPFTENLKFTYVKTKNTQMWSFTWQW